MLPPIGMFLAGSYNVLGLASFGYPPVMSAFQAFAEAIQAAGDVVQ